MATTRIEADVFSSSPARPSHHRTQPLPKKQTDSKSSGGVGESSTSRNPLKRKASAAALLTPPGSPEKGIHRATKVSFSESEDEDDELDEDESPKANPPERRKLGGAKGKNNRRVMKEVLAQGNDRGLGPAPTMVPRRRRQSSSTLVPLHAPPTTSPVGEQVDRMHLDSDEEERVTPETPKTPKRAAATTQPGALPQPPEPTTPTKRGRKSTSKWQAPVRDTPNNPFLRSSPRIAARTAEPFQEPAMMTYVFRGVKASFRNPAYKGDQTSESYRSALPPAHPDFSPDLMTAPKLLFPSKDEVDPDSDASPSTSRRTTRSAAAHPVEEPASPSVGLSMGIDSQIDVKPDIGLLNATTPGPPGHPPLEDEGMRRSSTAPQSILPLKRQRSMALGPKGRKRTVSQVVPETSRTVSNSSSKASPKSRCTVTRTSGKVPTLNSLFTRVVDVVQDAPDQEPRAYMYIYGGSKDVSEMTHIPTNDFYRLDLQTLVWEDLTKIDRGVFKECLDAEDPFSRQLLAHGLPYLDNPTSTLYRRGQRRFMLIFGGADVSGTPTNELISVDLERQTWERIRTRLLLGHATVTVAEGDFVLPRAGAGSIVVDDKLFIFGGWTMLKGKGKGKGKRGKGVAETVDAFSVLDLTTRVWLVRDRRYPPHVGSLGYNIDVYAPDVFKGCKLLLMRGKVDDTELMKALYPLTIPGSTYRPTAAPIECARYMEA
ncbi:hypothetical protein FRB99_008435 [Tulasnella sp. 403]|nr:hypothetical protein FRB99_008435 [Tulasnella sp. 403]